jgi:hypothetical protein
MGERATGGRAMGGRDRRDEVTVLFAQALDGDEHAELELGRRWLDDGDTTAERAAYALAAAVLAELERDPVYRAWTDAAALSGPPVTGPPVAGPPMTSSPRAARVGAWDARFTPGRHGRP